MADLSGTPGGPLPTYNLDTGPTVTKGGITMNDVYAYRDALLNRLTNKHTEVMPMSEQIDRNLINHLDRARAARDDAKRYMQRLKDEAALMRVAALSKDEQAELMREELNEQIPEPPDPSRGPEAEYGNS